MPNFLNDPNVQSVEITEFSGPNLLLDSEDVREPQCLDATNTEFLEGSFITRRGFGPTDITGIFSTIYNYVQSQYNRLVAFTGTQVNVYDLLGTLPTVEALTLATAYGMSAAMAGFRLMMAFFTVETDQPGMPIGAAPVRVWDGTFIDTLPNVENAFSSPPTGVTISASENVGVPFPTTPGMHRFMFLTTSWNGYTTPPGPNGAPFEFTFTGGFQVEVRVSRDGAVDWPNWVQNIRLIMTTAANPNRWFIFPTIYEVGHTNFDAVFDIDIDDETLLLYEEIIPGSHNDYFALRDGDMSPHKILAYGARMVYILESRGPGLLSTNTASAFYVSEPNLPQWITNSNHLLNLPEFRKICSGAWLGDSLYIFGPAWTYAFSDNLQFPSQWFPPRVISAAIGTNFVHGVSANTAHGYMWVAARQGLYWNGGGVYADLPASHYQTPHWNRINFNANVDSLEVIEDPKFRLVMVKAALDGSMTATHLLVWDYTNGFTPDRIKYCGLWALDSVAPGGLALILNPDSDALEPWLAKRSPSGFILRQKSYPFDPLATLYNDEGAGIDHSYTLGPLPKVGTEVLDHLGGDFRIRGPADLGDANVTTYSLDLTNPVSLAQIPLSLAPGRRFFRGGSKQSESCAVKIDNGAVANTGVIVSAIRWYYRFMGMRT